jgi:putative hydrolase of the HAD superfamily
MGERLGVAEAEFSAAYWRHRLPYDLGLPVAQYWERVLASLPPARAEIALADLIESDVASWTVFREPVWELARHVRARGGRTALLSNSGPEMMTGVRARRPLEPWFDVVVVSHEVGVAKPDPRIYEICLGRLGVTGPDALLVDDRLENLESAARLGVRTAHFTGDPVLHKVRELTAHLLEE